MIPHEPPLPLCGTSPKGSFPTAVGNTDQKASPWGPALNKNLYKSIDFIRLVKQAALGKARSGRVRTLRTQGV